MGDAMIPSIKLSMPSYNPNPKATDADTIVDMRKVLREETLPKYVKCCEGLIKK